MAVNGKSKRTDLVPMTVQTRTDELRPLLAKWRRRNRGKPWGTLVRAALRRELAPLAGKRHAHLVANGRKAA